MSIPRLSVDNPVAMNLLMLLIIGLGIWHVWHAERAFFPEVEPDRISIRGDAIEVRVPGGSMSVVPTARLALVADERGYEGSLRP